VERRKSSRQASDEAVQLTMLSADGRSDRSIAARLVERSAGGLRLQAADEIALGHPVRIDWPDELALGHVCHCHAEPDGRYTVGIRLNQVLPQLNSIRALARQVMGEDRVESAQPQRR